MVIDGQWWMVVSRWSKLDPGIGLAGRTTAGGRRFSERLKIEEAFMLRPVWTRPCTCGHFF
jgi:hypothetical protein